MLHHPTIPGVSADRCEARLRVLATSDLHAHLLPYDYYADQPTDTAGLARTATLAEQERAAAPNWLLLDNGDFLNGNPFGDYIAEIAQAGARAVHPVIDAMNVLGYDAATLGNHEFNFGLPFLNSALRDARFPVVCANVRPLGAGAAGWLPFVLIDRVLTCEDGSRKPIRIGITGFVPPQILVWDRPLLEGLLEVEDMVPAARRILPQMRAQGADLVIVLAHTGIAGSRPRAAMENAATALAAVPGIDAMVAGHTHLVFPSGDHAAMRGVAPVRGRLGGKPAVMPGFWGSHLGRIDLLLGHDGLGWRVARSRTAVLPITRRDRAGQVIPLVASSPAILRAVAPAHEAAVAAMRKPVGITEQPVHSFFSMLGADPCLRIVNAAQLWHLRTTCAGLPSDMPVLSATAPFKTGGRAGPDYFTNIPKGLLLRRNIADLYPFPNTICAVQIDGAQLRDWLEFSASVYRTHGPDLPEGMLTEAEFPTYLCDTILGVGYRIELGAAPRFSLDGKILQRDGEGRIRALTHAGRPVRDTDQFVVATNSYRASPEGGKGCLGFDRQLPVAPVLNRDILLAFLAAGCPGLDQPDPGWTLSAPSGSSFLYDTSPRALDMLDQIAAFAPEPLGQTTEGFARLRLHL